MEFTGERVVPWAKSMRRRPDLVQDHIARYSWALSYVTNKHVVDLGCGTGYGAYIMSWLAAAVGGVDHDEESIAFARQAFRGVQFQQTDLDADPYIPEADVYVAFEVLEHLEDPFALVSKLEGLLLWSIPVDNPSQFHKHVWSLEEIPGLFPLDTQIWYQLMSGNIVKKTNLPVHSVIGASTCSRTAEGGPTRQEEDLVLEILVP